MARAAFDQSPKAHCLSGTRVDIIKQLLSDLKNSPSRFVWLKGSPGRGKSAIAKSICTELRADNVPVTSFFFNKDGSQAHTSSAARFASTIARQLARISDEFGKELAKLDLEESSQNFSKEEQLEQLVISPATKVVWSSRVVLVLDALDECGDRDALRELVGLVGLLQRLPRTLPSSFLAGPSISLRTSSETYLPSTVVWMPPAPPRTCEFSCDAAFQKSLTGHQVGTGPLQ